MSRLTNKDYKFSNIDKILLGIKTEKSFSEVLNDNDRILIENALHKLSKYENTNLTPKEVEKLKANQNEVAIDYLGKVLQNYGIQTYPETEEEQIANDSYNYLIEEIEGTIKQLIIELKGGSDE